MDTEHVRSLVGLLLADGRLERMRGPVRSQIRAVFDGGVGEKDFLQEKADELLRALPRTNARSQMPEIRVHQTIARSNGSTTTVLRFRVSDTRLRLIYNLLYPRGRKCITPQALELVGGRAAAWLWAEGARLVKQGWVLRRVGRSAAEGQLLRDWLQLLTGTSAVLLEPGDDGRQGRSPRLLFEPAQAALLQSALLPYAPTSRRHLFIPTP